MNSSIALEPYAAQAVHGAFSLSNMPRQKWVTLDDLARECVVLCDTWLSEKNVEMHNLINKVNKKMNQEKVLITIIDADDANPGGVIWHEQ